MGTSISSSVIPAGIRFRLIGSAGSIVSAVYGELAKKVRKNGLRLAYSQLPVSIRHGQLAQIGQRSQRIIVQSRWQHGYSCRRNLPDMRSIRQPMGENVNDQDNILCSIYRIAPTPPRHRCNSNHSPLLFYSTSAPCTRSAVRRVSGCTDRVQPSPCNASAAAVPAACPVALAIACIRTAACASCVAEIGRPATRRF